MSKIATGEQSDHHDDNTIRIGNVYRAKVRRVATFGAFCELLGTDKEGLVHISDLENVFTKRIDDAFKVGDEFAVKVIDIDEKGRIGLSKKRAE